MERQSKVLVVDDDQFALQSIAKVLESESYQLVTETSGSEAIELLRQGSFDLVLTDLKMPGIDGLEVLKWTRETTPQAVVLILTGYASVESAIEALREGAYDYLVKPCSTEELKLKVERGLERVRLTEERQQAEEEIKRRNKELAALNAIAAAVSQSLDLKEMLGAALKESLAVLNAEGGVIYLLDETRQTLAPAVHRGLSQDVLREVTGFKVGEGLSGWAAESGEALVVADLAADFRNISPAFAREGWRAYAGVPIKSRGRVVGVMTLATRQEGYFRPDHVGLLSHIGNQIGVAIENARLYEAEQERRHVAETLYQSSTILGSTLELDEVLGLILQQLRQVIPYDSASVQRLQGECLEIMACQGFEEPDKVLSLAFPLDPKFPNCHVVVSKALLAIEDVAQDYPHFKDEADTYESGRIKSWLGVPLKVKDEVIGMIAMDRAELRPYTAEEVEMAMTFANQAAMAIENARLFEEMERLKAFNEGVVQGVAEAILIEDAQGFFTFANPAAEEMLGYTREELIGRHWTTIMPEEQVEKLRQELIKRTQRIEGRYETALRNKEGRVIPVIVGARPLFEGDKFAGILSAFTDITERKWVEQQLAYMATHDSLTGVPNRRGFFALAEQQLKMADRTKTKVSLLYADLDHLKQINDALGHPEGDRALTEVAHILKETFRESDIIARISGDEFVVLAAETDEVSAAVLTTRLRDNLEAHNARGDRPYKLSLSIGLVSYDPEHPCSADELLARADRAMYEQKRRNHKS
jgi:diguanylate cyclase (GGDEF)-like protein/PAS domain S-box-containing protein